MIKPTFQAREEIKTRRKEKISLWLERKLWESGFKKVVGLDEAGRGPLAGPVVAAAIVIQPAKLKIQNSKLKIILKKTKDSKQLSRKKRQELYKLITQNQNIKWGIGKVSQKMIDKINIKNAAELAMVKALKNLKLKPDFLIIDGNHIKNLKLKIKNSKLIVKADEKVFSCALASILAKVMRDKMMMEYHRKYPQYRFDLHNGYPTKLHLKMLKKYGPCKIHRKTFEPIQGLAKQDDFC